MKKQITKALIVGVDGMDFAITERFIREGKLPNLRRLAVEGAFCELAAANPAQSPTAWLSIATGKNPGKHGVFDFIMRDPKTYGVMPSYPKTARPLAEEYPPQFVPSTAAEPFWEILSSHGIRSTILRWPLSFPARRFRGKLLSGFGTPDLKITHGYPTFYTSEDPRAYEHFPVEVVPLRIGEHIVTSFSLFDGVGIPLKLERDIATRTMKISLGDYSCTVREGTWSDWARIRAKLPNLRRISGKARFFLNTVEPHIRLFMSPPEVDPLDPIFPISYPREYAEELARAVGVFHTLGLSENVAWLQGGYITEQGFIKLAEETAASDANMFSRELEHFHSGVLAVVFDTLDRIQHAFWQVDPATVERFYRQMDDFIGGALASIDEKTALFVISDHGCAQSRVSININSWLVREGYISLRNGHTKSGFLFEDVDWSHTKAYALGLSGLYLNRVGRESMGIVRENEAEHLSAELCGKLLRIVDPDTGERVFSHVWRREDIYHGPFVSEAPDLVLGASAGYRISFNSAVGTITDEVFVENPSYWNGDHICDPKLVPGVCFSNHAIRRKIVQPEDIAPTILGVYGVKKQHDMDGEGILDYTYR